MHLNQLKTAISMAMYSIAVYYISVFITSQPHLTLEYCNSDVCI